MTLTDPGLAELGVVGLALVVMVLLLKILTRLLDKFLLPGQSTENIQHMHAEILESLTTLSRHTAEIAQFMNEQKGVLGYCQKIYEQTERNTKKISELHEWHDHDEPTQPGTKIWWYSSEQAKQMASNVWKLLRGQRSVMRKMDIDVSEQDG